jgi:hypothetical protein
MHEREQMRRPAAGWAVALTDIEGFRLAGGSFAEQWVAVDNLGLLRQLGDVPIGQQGRVGDRHPFTQEVAPWV